MKTITEVRNSFWTSYPEYAPERRSRKSQNDYRADIRMSFVDYVDQLARSGEIINSLTNRVTL